MSKKLKIPLKKTHLYSFRRDAMPKEKLDEFGSRFMFQNEILGNCPLMDVAPKIECRERDGIYFYDDLIDLKHNYSCCCTEAFLY